jgi:mono/diheme cytochrome c family protein
MSPRALALPVAAGLAAAAVMFAVVSAVDDGGDEREGAGQAQGAGQTQVSSGATAPVRGHERGRELFFEMGCGSCHTLAAASASGEIGPNLDERLAAHSESSLKATIVRPPTSGGGTFSVMPDNFGERMSDRELDALVGFLLAARVDREP